MMAVMDKTAPDKLASARAFTEIICGWQETDTARLAMLRRGAGETLNTARGVTWFYSLLPRFESAYSDQALFLVATLLAFDRPALEGKRTFVGNFGATMHRLWLEKKGAGDTEKDKPNSSVARRFAILLDATLDRDGGEMMFRLRQTVRLALSQRSAGVGIDWPQLLHDLQRWNHPDRYIQKQWAREFYAPSTSETDDTQPDAPAN